MPPFDRLTSAGLVLAVSLFALGLPEGARAQAEAEVEAEADAPAAVADHLDAGAYLAARIAESHSDLRQAALYHERALKADPDNVVLLDGLVFARLLLGDIEGAEASAIRLGGLDGANPLARMAQLSAHALREDNAAVLAFETGQKPDDISLLDRLLRGWAEVGLGKMSDAVSSFDEIASQGGLKPYGLYHKALALALAGDHEGADEILSGRAAGTIHLNNRGMLARIQILSQLERRDEAMELVNGVLRAGPDAQFERVLARLEAGETLAFDVIQSARDGMAEAFFTLSTLVNGEAEAPYVLLHSRLALTLSPRHGEARLMSAEMLAQLGQQDLSIELLATVPPDDPTRASADLVRARALFTSGRREEAISLLRELVKAVPDSPVPVLTLGDFLHGDEQWDEAIKAYDIGVPMLGDPVERHWPLLFNRGIAKERSERYPEAIAEFRSVLKLKPEQPEVLNYLGYTLLEQGGDYAEALEMIQRAVKAKPDSGLIIDSLGWAYFRLGRYDEALVRLEEASRLEPIEAEITDHLGDAYWMVGRKREARFQWRRALSQDSDNIDTDRIRRKLEVGLDVVREDEAKAGKAADLGGED